MGSHGAGDIGSGTGRYCVHPLTVQRLMGHTDIQTTMIYAHLAPDHLADAVDKLAIKV